MALALTFGCSQAVGGSSYRVTIPILEVQPREVSCRINETADLCTVLLTRDLAKIARALKAACLALGGTPAECQAD